jgi:peptide chain release factor 3
MRVFIPGEDRVGAADEIISGIDNPECESRFGEVFAHARQEIDLVQGVSPGFDREAFLAGQQTPLFFGSAINNFGVQEVLDAVVDFASPPGPHQALQRGI